MGRIHILGEDTANKIAAGEVIERPASVIKELVENSIDAGATSITVEIKDGGISYIRVSDNGCGMDAEDAKNSFIRHATSKIESADDLNNINTLGFRGEALASMASVAQIEMLTKPLHDTYGTRITIDGGRLTFAGSAGCQSGTTITVTNLFYNTPARLKFLKKESREGAIISDILFKLALSRPDISFKFINGGKLIFSTPGDGSLKNAILVLYGREIFNSLISVSYKGNILSITGYIGNGDAARSNRNFQVFFINNRYIKNKTLSTAVDNAYKTFLPVNKFGFCILFISICPDLVDVNVHPTKADIRFQDDREVFSSVFNTVRNGLAGEVLIPDISRDGCSVKEEQQYIQLDGYDDTPLSKNKEYVDTSIMMPYGTGEKNGYGSQNPLHRCTNDDKKEYTGPKPAEPNEHDTADGVKNLIPPLIVIGQCSLTYILAQGPDGLYIIDQHAAHERVMYERYKKSFECGGVQSQKLLAPVVIELTPKEILNIKDNDDIVSKLGFDIEFFGNNSVILRSVPIIFGEPQLKKLFLEIVDLMDSKDSSQRNYFDRVLYTISCRSAVKANDRLSHSEMEGLINMLKKAHNPYTCPHGRPTIIKLTNDELERRFKRIQ